MMIDLPLSLIPAGVPFTPKPEHAGRRLRVLSRLASCRASPDDDVFRTIWVNNIAVMRYPGRPTYGEMLRVCDENQEAHAVLSELPLITGGPDKRPAYTLGQLREWIPTAHQALRDLHDEITVDITEACAAFDDPDLWYPGVEDQIDPVSDEHVTLVIAAMQRELQYETRKPIKAVVGPDLPAAPLGKLPGRIQRALVERRRYRYLQYGITPATWRTGVWSLWQVQLDPDWTPRFRGIP